jgi:FixJ family two-component response regulator
MGPSPSSHASIVIVDDDASGCRAIARLVRSAGMSVATFLSGEAFLAHLTSDTALEIDCVVIDVQMPDMSGLDVQNHLVREGRILPIVFITAHDSPEAREQSLSRGAFAFLRKSVTREVLLQTIEAARQGHSAANKDES